MISKKKILIIFGTRPELIKLAPIYWELKKKSSKFETKVCITSQHKSLVKNLITFFDIKVDYDLDIIQNSQSLISLNSLIFHKLENILSNERPDLIIVQGDTLSAYVGALSAFYNKIKISHVEAGLRSNNIFSPYPEEFFRKSISLIADYNFAPTKTNKINLLKENVHKEKIYVTGNTVIDTLKTTLNSFKKNKLLNKNMEEVIDRELPFDWKRKKYVLITGHRRENIGKAFFNIMEAFNYLSKKFPNINFVFPIHPNPLVRKIFKEIPSVNNFHIIEPLEYPYFLMLLNYCYFVVTDSGGIQEEAPVLGKPVLVLRDTTERNECIDVGVVKLIGSNKENVITEIENLITDREVYDMMAQFSSPYGDGTSSNQIVQILTDRL